MDLQVYAIILIVFLVSFMSYLFISKFLPHGKTFDEMIAEKKRMREELLGVSKNVSSGKQNNAGGKKKPRKDVKKQKDANSKAAKEVTSNESDASESSEVHSEPSTPPETLILRKNAPKPNQQAKKGKGKGGILINRNEPVLVKEIPIVEEVNHFEEIHPKDAFEMFKSAPKEENEKKHFREHKKTKPVKAESPPPQMSPPKPQAPKEIKVVEEKVIRKKRSEQTAGGARLVVSEETGITPLIREMSRTDLTKNQIQVLIDFLLNKQSDTITHDPTEWSEGKSDLVQKLKKQLQEKEAQLKNEQDALTGTQSKLKELRSEYNNDKAQFNSSFKTFTEQLQNSKMEVKNLQGEIHFLTEKHLSEKQSMSLSFKQLQSQYMQMKETLKAQEGLPTIQQIQNDNQILQQEIIKKNQQVMELNSFVEESRQKDDTFAKLVAENEGKIAEYDVHLRKKDERCSNIENELRQRVQELSSRDNELQKLNVELSRAKELEKVVQMQTYDMEQLKKQLSDQQHKKDADESNKIEMRNLQNALDSSKKELESQRALVTDYKVKLDDLTKQLTESKQLTNSKSSGDNFLLNEKINEMTMTHMNVVSQKDKLLADYQKQVELLQKAEGELTKQIEEQKGKNNELRTKNWKLVEALQSAQSSTAKSTHNSNLVTHQTVEVTKVKDLFAQHFPDIKTSTIDGDGTKWLEGVVENLKTQLVSNKSGLGNNTSTNPSIANNNNVTNKNHLNNCSEVETTNNLNNSAVNGDSISSAVAENEVVLLQNAQLKTTVEEYKNIISETESMLKNLESKVREQDAYWTKVVLLKDNEIANLKTVTETS